MILKYRIMAAILRKNGVSAAMVARELGISVEELVKTLKEGWPLGYEEAKTLLAMFGAEDMAKAVDWEAINASCPI